MFSWHYTQDPCLNIERFSSSISLSISMWERVGIDENDKDFDENDEDFDELHNCWVSKLFPSPTLLWKLTKQLL